jgi:thiol-activated cytolysin
VQSIDSYDALIAFIKQGGNYSRESPGAPIAYKLSYLKDNSPARMSFTTDYTVKDCVRVSQKVHVQLDSIAVDAADDAGSDLEIFGQIWVEGSNATMLFDKDGDNWVRIHEGAQFGGGTPLAEAVLDVAPQAGAAIRLHAHLRESDTFADDDLGDETIVLPFEAGWRKGSAVILTGSGSRVRVNFSLAPI